MSDLAGKRIAVYARFSTDKQNPLSCADQIAKVRRYVEGRGGAVDPSLVFRDEGISGAVWDRPGLSALLAEVRTGAVDIIVAEDLGRVSRDTEDSARFRKILAHADVRLLAIDDGLDTSNEGAVLQGDMLATFKTQYRREISTKTLRGCSRLAEAGKATGGLPYGFRSVPGTHGNTIEIDADQAAIVVQLFEAYAAGKSLGECAAWLNSRRIDPPRAKSARSRGEWLVSTCRSILHNERYIGRWVYGATVWKIDPETRQRRPKKRNAPLHVDERPHLAIVDTALWQRVRSRFHETGRMYTGKRTIQRGKMTYPLSGILRCQACGSLLTITGGEAERRYYGCTGARRGTCSFRSHIRESVAREKIVGAIRFRFASAHALIEKMIDEEWAASAVGDDRRLISERIERRTVEIKRAVDFILSGSSDAIRDRLAELEALQRADRAMLARLAAASERPVDAPTAEDVLAAIDTALDGPAGEVRTALRNLLDDGKVDIEQTPDGRIVARGGLLPMMVMGAENGVICGGRI